MPTVSSTIEGVEAGPPTKEGHRSWLLIFFLGIPVEFVFISLLPLRIMDATMTWPTNNKISECIIVIFNNLHDDAMIGFSVNIPGMALLTWKNGVECH